LAAVPPDSHPDERSIAVLAFTNLSGDSEQEYFSDGVSEDIITSLSKISGLFVIARNSSFAYKGNAVDIKEVSRALGVRHVLEGSVRKAGNRVRVTAQLIDGTTGGHVWAEKYDRDLDDIFAVQDDVTQQIVAALKIHLTPEERTRIDLGETTNTEAYDHVLRARDSYLRTTRDSLTDAAEQLHRAIDLDPNYARARSQLAQVYLTARYHGWSDDPDRALVDAYELASEAVRLGPDLPHAHSILGSALLWRGEIDIALTEAETALALDPNDADGYEGLAEIKLRLARYEEALELFDKARAPQSQLSVFLSFGAGFVPADDGAFCRGRVGVRARHPAPPRFRAPLHFPRVMLWPPRQT
jgi:adenylate cyclase